MREMMNTVDLKVAVVPQTATNSDTAIVGEIIDRRGADSLLFAIATGTLTDANATFAVLVEEGDDSGLSDAAAVADADLVGTEALAGFTFAADIKCRKVAYVGMKRYVRITITPSGNNSGDAPVAAIAILGHLNQTPSANPPA